MGESGDVVDFEAAKERVEQVRQEQKEKDLEVRFKKAIGWKEKGKRKVKKPKAQSKGPNPTKPRGKGRRKK